MGIAKGRTVSTPEGCAEIARAFMFKGDELKRKKDRVTTFSQDAIACYRSAHEWFMSAYGLTIGHSRRARYEEAADHCCKAAAELEKAGT